MAVTYITRIFRRRSDLFEWHWRTDCNKYKAAAMQKKRGKTFVYQTKTDGTRPTTYHLCPGCQALDDRIKSKEFPFLTKKVVALPGRLIPTVLPVQPIVPRYYYGRIGW